jgi:hypothetical protein
MGEVGECFRGVVLEYFEIGEALSGEKRASGISMLREGRFMNM